ncbi:MAG: CDP-glycerol glycerophosphotransferase family protein [Clostridium sp.]|uniref:CDP-glycerol glycerophosphotransferase family protein n=1 Tax=Clostridium sp. TaxID=1506 RepID=UPI00307049C9
MAIVVNLNKCENTILFSHGKKVDIADVVKITNIDEKSIKFLKELENQVFEDGSISKLYIYDGLEMYSFYRATIYEKLKEFMTRVITLEEIIKFIIDNEVEGDNKLGESNEIEIVTDDIIIYDLGKNLFSIKNIILNEEYVVEEDTENKFKISNSYHLLKRALKGLKHFTVHKFKYNKEKLLLCTQVSAINTITINNISYEYDALYGKIKDQLEKEYNVFNLQVLNSKDIIIKANGLGKNYFPFEYIRVYRKMFGKMLINKEKIVDNLDDLKFFNFYYGDYDLKGFITKYVFNNLEHFYMNYVEEILVFKRLMKSLKIKKVLAVDEADRPRCMIVAGNLLGIETFGIQHGLINETSVAYLVPSNEKKLVPKTTFLWGTKFKELLTNNTEVFTEENIAVIGQPRTDYLYEKNLVDKDEYRKEEKNHKRILFATQPIKDLSEDSFIMLCEALKGSNNYELIVKLHPSDSNLHFYEKNINEYKLNNVEITKEKDLYDCLIWCDMVISVHSTVILEGAILDKPSICILLPKYYDEGNFVKEELSLGAKSSDELLECINKINAAGKGNYKSFIERNFYKVDGKVSERAIKIINDK